MDFLGIGTAEVLLILVVAILVLGPSKIVDFARTLGRISHNLKKASNDFTSSVTREVDEAERADAEKKKKDQGGQDPDHRPPGR